MEAIEALEAALEGAGVADLESLLLPLLSPEETWEMSGSCDMTATARWLWLKVGGCSGDNQFCVSARAREERRCCVWRDRGEVMRCDATVLGNKGQRTGRDVVEKGLRRKMGV